ncbi:MAG: aldo/keto reductase [Actinomycetota bacterium]|nr:aldo/keto reductase [Actinomycetota bacterium]
MPGAKRTDQVDDNVAAADMPPLSDEVMDRIREIYDHNIRQEVHHQW